MSRNGPHHGDTVVDTVQSSSGAAVSAIAASWCRSMLHHGLDPRTSPRRARIETGSLASRRAQHEILLAVAAPVLDQTFRSVGRSGCGVMLSDADGIILDRRTSAADADSFAAAGLVEGGLWSEAEEGTNGIGTCLFEGKPLIIHRDQHFASRNIDISCMDAPVYDPTGRLIAALDVSSCRDDHGPAMVEIVAAVVRDAAQRIERDYFCRHFAGERIVFLPDDAAAAGLLAVDRDGLVIGASRGARAKLGLDDAMLAGPQPLDRLLGIDIAPSFDDGDRTVLRRALAQTGGNATEAARLLGIGRATLYRRLSRTGLRH